MCLHHIDKHLTSVTINTSNGVCYVCAFYAANLIMCVHTHTRTRTQTYTIFAYVYSRPYKCSHSYEQDKRFLFSHSLYYVALYTCSLCAFDASRQFRYIYIYMHV